MELKDLIKAERELTGVTQKGFAEYMNEKYKRNEINLSKRIVNIIESSGTISDPKLRIAFLNDFCFVDVEREERILSNAYEFADIVVGQKIKIKTKELFSFTCKKELCKYIENIMQSSSKQLKKKVKYLTWEIDEDFSDEVSLKPASGLSLVSLNDTAKLIFYIVYYYFLLENKQKEKKEKISIKRSELDKPGAKKVYERFDLTDGVNEREKGKRFSLINNRISLLESLINDEAMKFLSDVMKKATETFPSNCEDEEIKYMYKVLNDTSNIILSFEKTNFEKLNYEDDKDLDNVFKYLKEFGISDQITIKLVLLYCYSSFHNTYLVVSKPVIDNLINRIREKKYFNSTILESTVENIASDLNKKYDENKGNFTVDLFFEFAKQQKRLYQLYAKYNYIAFNELLDSKEKIVKGELEF